MSARWALILNPHDPTEGISTSTACKVKGLEPEASLPKGGTTQYEQGWTEGL